MTTNPTPDLDADTVDRIRERYSGARLPAGTPLVDVLEAFGIPHNTRPDDGCTCALHTFLASPVGQLGRRITERREQLAATAAGAALSGMIATMAAESARAAAAQREAALASQVLRTRARWLTEYGRSGMPNTAAGAMLGHVPADLLPVCGWCGQLSAEDHPACLDEEAEYDRGRFPHRADDQVDALRFALGALPGDRPRDVLDRTVAEHTDHWHVTVIDDPPPDPDRPYAGAFVDWYTSTAPGSVVAHTEWMPTDTIGDWLDGMFTIGDEDRCAPLPDDVDAGGTQLETGKVGMPGPRELCPAPLDHCLARHDHGDMGAGWRP